MQVLETNDEMHDLGVSFVKNKEVYTSSKAGQLADNEDEDSFKSDDGDMFNQLEEIQSTR